MQSKLACSELIASCKLFELVAKPFAAHSLPRLLVTLATSFRPHAATTKSRTTLILTYNKPPRPPPPLPQNEYKKVKKKNNALLTNYLIMIRIRKIPIQKSNRIQNRIKWRLLYRRTASSGTQHHTARWPPQYNKSWQQRQQQFCLGTATAGRLRRRQLSGGSCCGCGCRSGCSAPAVAGSA